MAHKIGGGASKFRYSLWMPQDCCHDYVTKQTRQSILSCLQYREPEPVFET